MPNRSIGKETGMLVRAAHIYLRHQFRNYSFGHAQAMTLHLISHHDGISQNELVQHFHLDKSSVTSQLKILEKNGYIYRRANKEDSRSRHIYITEKTEAIQQDLNAKVASWSEILLKDFSEEQKQQIFFLLDKMKANAFEAIDNLKENEENQ